MKKAFSRISLIVGLGLAGAAQAEILSSGPAYVGNPTGGTITCRVFNAGLSGATIITRQIFDNTGAAVSLSSDSCGTVLATTKTCAFSAPASGNLAYSCRLISYSADDNLRGVTELYVSPNQFFQLPLTK